MREARYLIEDNTLEKIEYDLDTFANVHYVKSVLRAFLGGYKLLDEKQTEAMEKSIKNVCVSNVVDSRECKTSSRCFCTSSRTSRSNM